MGGSGPPRRKSSFYKKRNALFVDDDADIFGSEVEESSDVEMEEVVMQVSESDEDVDKVRVKQQWIPRRAPSARIAKRQLSDKEKNEAEPGVNGEGDRKRRRLEN